MTVATLANTLASVDATAFTSADISGVISVRCGETTLLEHAYGLADIANGRDNRVDTRFGTASLGKILTAVTILRLVEQGEVGLDTTLGELLLHDLGTIDPGVTVQQLLCHTSGVPDYFDESVMDDYAELWQTVPNYTIRCSEDLLPLFRDKPMMYTSGERFQYNNSGYVLLGLLLEAIADEPFDAVVADQVLAPCGMNATGWYELDRLPGNCANSYILDEHTGEYYTNIYSIDAKGSGAGGAFTTAGDMHRFWMALTCGRLLGPELLEQMLQVHASDPGEQSWYGLGVWLFDGDSGHPFVQGSDPGVECISSCRRRDNTVITVLSNRGDDVWRIYEAIWKSLG